MIAPTQLNTPKSASVRKVYELLKEIVRSPGLIDEKMRQIITPALSTQGGLAAFEYPELGIIRMSLNTHKAIANDAIEGGYDALNDYRKSALEKVKHLAKSEVRPSRGTIDWYKGELFEATKRLDKVTNDIALMSQRLDEVLALAQDMAREAGKEDEFYKRRGELLRKFRTPQSI